MGVATLLFEQSISGCAGPSERQVYSIGYDVIACMQFSKMAARNSAEANNHPEHSGNPCDKFQSVLRRKAGIDCLLMQLFMTTDDRLQL